MAHFERVLRVNLMGVLHTLKAVLPDMVKRNRGCCVVTGSIGGFMGEGCRSGALPQVLSQAWHYAQEQQAYRLTVRPSGRSGACWSRCVLR